MFRVIYALILRATTIRYGRLKIGYLWAFIEPIMLVCFLTIVFTYIRLRHTEMPLIQWILSGVLAYILFRDTVTQTMHSMRTNLNLLYFPQVQVFDFGTAYTILELFMFFLVMLALSLFVWFSELEIVSIEDPLRIIFAAFMIASLGYGLGTFVGSLLPLFPSLQFLTQALIIRPSFLLSGVVFPIDNLPEEIIPYALLNPMLQLVELMRSAYSDTYESKYIDLHYLTIFIIITVLLGLLTQRAFRRYAFRP